MDLYPAIDLREGRCVRLIRGSFDDEVRYSHDPVAVARSFAAQGAPWLHVVDLDAARTGEPVNLAVIAAICAAVDVPVQCGGGVRSLDAAARLTDVGAERVVVGTAAVERPALISDLASQGHSVAVGIDSLGDEVATHGWEQRSGLRTEAVLAEAAERGADAVVVTQISRDGTGQGPDIEGLVAVLEQTSLDVIASGGIGQLDHIAQLARLTSDERRLAGAICGKALHDGVFSVTDALAAVRSASARGERSTEGVTSR